LKTTVSGFATKRELRAHINGGAASAKHGIQPISSEADIVAECLAEGLSLAEINEFMMQSDNYAASLLTKIRAGLGSKAK
jgi:hypothetical protein